MNNADIRRDLQTSGEVTFDQSPLYARVFALAERKAGKALPRAAIPKIQLQSPKITRKLTTEWFATRVDARYQRCLGR